jgi:hypothetical protein
MVEGNIELEIQHGVEGRIAVAGEQPMPTNPNWLGASSTNLFQMFSFFAHSAFPRADCPNLCS